MRILIGGYNSDIQYLGKIDSENDNIIRIMDRLSKFNKEFDYEIKEVSNGTYESLESGVITVGEI